MVATHADADHIQGLSDVARNFEIGEVLVASQPDDDPEFLELDAVVRDRNVGMQLIGEGVEKMIGGVRIQILNPADTLGQTSNNSSVVMKLTFGSRSILLTGDIEREAETRLVDETNIDLRADIVKVPHHGSRTSSTTDFIKKVGASVAIISVGRRSRFGHPHKEVIERWGESGAEVLTTGANGTVTVSTNGDGLYLRTFRPRK